MRLFDVRLMDVDYPMVPVFMRKYAFTLSMLVCFLLTGLMHAPHFKKDLMSAHVWRQTQTQSTIDNFYEEDMNILNPRKNDRGNGDGIFRMEFPLMQWLVACVYHVFGPSLLLTRGCMFAIGLVSILGMAMLIHSLTKCRRLSFFGAWAFCFSPSFYYYIINPIPDNMALCFMLFGLAYYFSFNASRDGYKLWLSGLFLGLAALCKLPYIIFFSVPISAWFFENRNFRLQQRTARNSLVWIPLLFMLLPAIWYAWVIPNWDGNPVVTGVLHDFESYRKLPGYILTVIFSTIPELMLNYAAIPFLIAGIWIVLKEKGMQSLNHKVLMVMSAAIVCYYLYESNTITDVHDYYLFPFFPMLFILVTLGIKRLACSTNWAIRMFVTGLLLLLPLTCYLRIQVRWNPDNPGFNKDFLQYKTELRSAVPDHAPVVCGSDHSHFIYWYYIDKKGWGFQDDTLSPDSLKRFIHNGAQYLYSDSRKVDESKDILPYLENLLLERESVRVYKLKRL